MESPSSAQAGAGRPVDAWEVAIGRGANSLKATTRRLRVSARNPARAALAALERQGIGITEAHAMDLRVAVYVPGTAMAPRALFAVEGTPQMPELRLRYARMLPDGTRLRGSGGPLDNASLHRELPRALRQRSEAELGERGVRDMLSERFWQHEVSVYTGTALVLTALGFPMTPAVFVIGGVLLFLHGAVRVAWQEGRLALRRRRIARDPDAQAAIRRLARYRLFARTHDLNADTPPAQLRRRVLRGDLLIPDGCGNGPLRVMADEDARIDAGGLPGEAGGAAAGGDGDGAMPAETTPEPQETDSAITIVFRTRKQPAAGDTSATAGADRSGKKRASQADDRAPRVPAVVDATAGGGGVRDDEIEVIDAELLDPDEDLGRGGGATA